MEGVLSDRYVLGQLIGRGGAAEVYQAHDLERDEAVAVKIFPVAVSKLDAQRQQREISSLAGLEHPGLVTLRHTGDLTGRRYLVMDLVAGPTLRDRLLDAPMPPPWVIKLGVALAEALTYIHARSMVHRDVKPTNVLLDEQDRPRLADFGLAQLADATRMTASGFITGTPAYLAPEQVRGGPVDAAADVYALGLVLLECLTGRCEYPGAPVEAAIARLHRAPEIPMDVPPWLRLLLAEITSQDPLRRPCAARVAAALRDEHFDSRPTARLSISWLADVRTRSRRVAAGLVAATAALAVAVVMGVSSGADNAPTGADPRPVPGGPGAGSLVAEAPGTTGGPSAGVPAPRAPGRVAVPADDGQRGNDNSGGRSPNGKGKGKSKSGDD